MAIKPATDLLTQFAHDLSGGEDSLDFALRTKKEQFRYTADVANAASNYALLTTPIGQAINVTSIDILPMAALTANDTNFKTLAVAVGDQAGGVLAAAFAQKTTQITGGTGNWVARTKVNLFTGNQTVAANSALYLAVTFAMAGVIIPESTIVVTYQVL